MSGFTFQTCHIEMVSWSVAFPEISLNVEDSRIFQEYLRPHVQWEVSDHWIYVKNTNVNGQGFQAISFVFQLKRKPSYVMLNRIFPCFLILLLELAVFTIPSDEGEKLAVGITLILAQTVFLLVIETDLPRTSDQVPVLSKQTSIYVFIIY